MADLTYRRSSYLSGCLSPSCVPVHEEYSRIHPTGGGNKSNRSRSIRKLLRKIVNESKSICRPAKPLTFQYDAVSYSQNFDEGCYREHDEYARYQYVSTFTSPAAATRATVAGDYGNFFGR